MCYWGYSYNDISCCSIKQNEDELPSNIVLISRCEDPDVKAKLGEAQFKTVEAAGAGYKVISVALGQAGAYVLSKKTTYRWDICGPHSILVSQGGGLLDFKKYTTNPDCCAATMKYSNVDSEVSNDGGLIAFRDKETLKILTNVLC